MSPKTRKLTKELSEIRAAMSMPAEVPRMEALYPFRDALNKADRLITAEWKEMVTYMIKHGWPKELVDAVIQRLEIEVRGMESMLRIMKKHV
jgi:chemotaxis regulatin CheY-phosphate phosphatase CheZ